MKNTSLLLGILLIAWSCEQKPQTENRPEWIKQYHVIRSDGGVSAIVWFDDHFIAHRGGNSFIALCSAGFQRDTAFETLLGKQGGKLMTSFAGDSLFTVENDQQYWWDQNSRKWSAAGPYEEPECYPLFEDKEYLVTGVCHGEFGGSIAFFNKKTGKTHGAPMICPVQVEKKGGEYYVLSYLGHFENYSSITVVPDPEEMREYPDCKSVFSTAAGFERRIISNYFNYFKQGQKMSPADSLEYVGLHRGATLWKRNLFFAGNSLLFREDQPYLLFSDTSNHIGRLEGDSLEVIDHIAGSQIFLEGTVTVRNNAHFFTFADRDTRGFVFIKKDTMYIAVFKPK